MTNGARPVLGARNFRRSFRFPLVTPVDAVRGPTRYARGETLDISRDGVAIRVLPFLQFNEEYEFFLHGIGRFNGTVVRRFNNYCFGIRFNIPEDSKQRIDRAIAHTLRMAEKTLRDD